jgi:AAA family ATP:ADP antiporter
VNAYGVIVVSQFWVYANSSSDPREMKRICGVVGGGAILGGLVGGIAASALANRVSLRWSIAAAAVLLAASAPMLLRVGQDGGREQEARPGGEPGATSDGAIPLFKASYIRWLAAATLCSVVVTGLLDYQLKIVVQQMHPTASQLTSFFGRLYVAMNLVALAIQLFATRAVLQWLGAGSAAAVLPAGLALGTGAMIVSPGLTPVLATRLWDQIVRFSLHRSAVELLFFPLRPTVKRRAKAIIGAGIERVGDALAGVLILAAGVLFDGTPITLTAIIFALVVVWLVASIRVRHGYVRELGRNLARMTLEPEQESVSLRERSILKEAVGMLHSPFERVALHAIDLLEQHAPQLLDARLSELLTHASARVRIRALERAIHSRSPVDHPRLAELARDRDPMVRLHALRIRCATAGGRLLDALDEYLTAEDAELRSTAFTYLVQESGDADLPAVRELLERTLATGCRDDRVAVAAALGAGVARTDLHQLLAPLLADPDVDVRCAALRSAGQAAIVEHVPAVIRALASSETEAAARDALFALGERAIEPAGDALIDAGTPVEIRRILPRILGELPVQASVNALFRERSRDDVVVSYRILRAANNLRSLNQELAFPADLVEDDLLYDVRQFLVDELHAESQAKKDGHDKRTPADRLDQAERFLILVLRERMAQAFNRVFRRLGLLHTPGLMLSAYSGILSEQPRVRANAVEYLERALSAEQRALVVPLLPGAKRAPRLQLSEQRFNLKPMTGRESLSLLLSSDDLWLRSCALYVVGRRQERQLMAEVDSNLESADARVAETAGWAKAELAARRR